MNLSNSILGDRMSDNTELEKIAINNHFDFIESVEAIDDPIALERIARYAFSHMQSVLKRKEIASGFTARDEIVQDNVKQIQQKNNGKKAEFTDDGRKCKCGRSQTHRGRCWARRGKSGPPSTVKTAKIEKEEDKSLICSRCGAKFIENNVLWFNRNGEYYHQCKDVPVFEKDLSKYGRPVSGR